MSTLKTISTIDGLIPYELDVYLPVGFCTRILDCIAPRFVVEAHLGRVVPNIHMAPDSGHLVI